MDIILGSTSPYKKTLLEKLVSSFETVDSEIDELSFHEDTVRDTALALSEHKARAILEQYQGTDTIIITSDVAGELDGEFLGKPESLEEAYNMIMSYSGRVVSIWCGTTLADANTGEMYSDVTEATVSFAPLNAKEVNNYVREMKPLDKGGAIAVEEIEDRGFVKSITGEYEAIIGISLNFVETTLDELNADI